MIATLPFTKKKSAFPQTFTVGGASWTSDPSMEAENCKIKPASMFQLTFLPTTISYELKKSNYLYQNLDNRNLLFLIEIPYSRPDLHCSLCWIFRKFLRNYIWRSASFIKVTALNTVTSITANSLVDIVLQVLLNFQNTIVFKTIVKNTFCQCVN